MATQSYNTEGQLIGKYKGQILAHAIPQEVSGRFGVKKEIPKNSGDTIILRRWLPAAVPLLMPLLEDTVLAWMEVKLFLRAQKQGWSRYFEFFAEGAGKAYTISSVMVLRAGAWATRPYTTMQLVVRDAHPFIVGLHMWLGDRVGGTRKHDYSGRIYIDRISKLTRARSRTAWQSWAVTIGDERGLADPGQVIFERMESFASAIQTLGVF